MPGLPGGMGVGPWARETPTTATSPITVTRVAMPAIFKNFFIRDSFVTPFSPGAYLPLWIVSLAYQVIVEN